MKIIFLLVLILLVVEGFPGAFNLVCSPPTVQTEPGQDVVLSCAVEPPFDLTDQTVEWSRDTDVIVHVYRSRADNQFLQNQKFRGRTVLIHQNLKDGKVSLRLINVTKEDEGNYSCCLPNHEVQSSVTLTVVSQMNKKTNKDPGSGLSSGSITVIVLGVVGVILVILGILGW
ncbi:Myelin-oligodendrocyte glycoprotein [Oryzias melastigma]|uniref:Myelin-oligodendrocyte glycoprotein n=1 Tax=Oryzias melastigma TaxID=30732 RepID=A0A834C5D2_ORYME|nr:Myelin-oligodendrocyte glycoprotein [Oryzias melastigma]